MKYELTDFQRDAVNQNGKVVLKACPGSGKTFVVSNRIIKLVRGWQEKNKGIALLSFTNVAHEEVIRKVKEISGTEKLYYPHFSGTLDSFISKFILLPFGHLIIGNNKKPRVIENESNEYCQFVKSQYRYQCHKSMCNPLDFYIDESGCVKDMSNKMDKCLVSGTKPCVQLKNSMYRKGLITYKDANIIAIKLLKIYPSIGKTLASRFPTIIIDEAQDTSSEQMEIINLLSSYGVENIMLIGDPDQAIYEWRDADPSVFLNKYNSGEWISKELNENFRCSQKICNATKIFSTLSSTSIAKGESSQYGYKPRIVFYDKTKSSNLVQYFITECINNNIKVSADNVAILSRGRSGLLGKDYSRIGDLWKNTLTFLFASAAYERDYGSYKKAINMIERGLFLYFIDNSEDVREVDESQVESRLDIDIWNKLIRKFYVENPLSDTILDDWIVEVKKVLSDISVKLGISKVTGAEIKVKTRDTSCPDFRKQPIKNFFIKSISKDYLNSTIHAVKGRTFEGVLLKLETNGKLTSNIINKRDIESEEIRTAYVAMTRAKKILMIAIPNTVKERTLVRFPKSEWDIVKLD